MIILGIDPGLATVGYGAIEQNTSGIRPLDYGVITTPPGVPLPERLTMIEEDLLLLLEKFGPDAVAVEELFFNKNVTNAIAVAHARGIILLTAFKRVRHIYEYTPMQIKQGLTGYGKAEKLQVQHMVKSLLKLTAIPKPDDAADALAVAICHSQTKNFRNLFSV